MLLRSMVLKNFRNHAKRDIKFSPQTTAIIGPNATGKSNILEAIYLCSIGKSVRAEKDEELIRFDEDTATIELLLSPVIQNASERSEESSKKSVSSELEDSTLIALNDMIKLTVIIHKNEYGKLQKAFIVNGVKRRRLDFVGHLRSVLFTPEDIELIIDSPSTRREYINNVLSQVDSDYRLRLSRYENSLKRRNKVLYYIREGKARGTDLHIWDQILVETGERLVEARETFFKEINEVNTEFPKIKWHYLPRPISQDKLDENRARDIDAAQTLSGPHRDDFEFFDQERNLHTFGSRGEQRMGVLALKLAEVSFIEQRKGERPILLLDDIFSELDEKHRHTVMGLIGRQQSVITSTEEEYIDGVKKEAISLVEL